MPKLPSLSMDVAVALPSSLGSLDDLLSNLTPVPSSWLTESTEAEGVNQLECLPCEEYEELVQAWEEALNWTEGLDCALACLLASVMTTNLVGEQIWVEIIGPPSSGKTTLLEGISVNKRHVVSKDTIRGFYSGWQGATNGASPNFIDEVRGKHLAMKEGDAFVKAPNVQQILSEGRGIYDRVGRNHYRNGAGADNEGTRMTWSICGTSAIREEIDSSELGARFLACVVMDGIDDEFENDVLWKSVQQEASNVTLQATEEASSQYPEELALAMQLTGGYLNYLCEDPKQLTERVQLSKQSLLRCGRLGKFVSYARARPSQKKDSQSEAEREFSSRLAKQITRFAISIAAVMNKTELDEKVMQKVRKIAFDTAKGKSLKLLSYLYEHEEGSAARTIAIYTHEQKDQTIKLLQFLRKIEAVLLVKAPKGKRTSGNWYKLHPTLRELFNQIDYGDL